MDGFESLEDIQLDVYDDVNHSQRRDCAGPRRHQDIEERDGTNAARDSKLFLEVIGVSNLQPTG